MGLALNSLMPRLRVVAAAVLLTPVAVTGANAQDLNDTAASDGVRVAYFN
ncbi:hypothetical protein QKW60_16395 [Defluviimonas aestuarii]|nr:hypothetical protein [Defluviimonas aestuarii]MDI3337989.1 hypothetical protein [Defluviimonas aestuarii]